MKKPSKTELAQKRAIQRNLVYVIGLPPALADEALLESLAYFGQYGVIRKCVVNKSSPYSSSVGLSYRAYINYTSEVEATLCIKACDGFEIEGRTLKATYGTTKYCNHFLNGTVCPKPGCLYLHELASRMDCFTREEIQKNQHLQPHNSILSLLKVRVTTDSPHHVLPQASLLRERFISEDCLSVPTRKERAYSMNTPPRKNSRFGFNEESNEDSAAIPCYLEPIYSQYSPAEQVATVSEEHISEILKEPWAKDIFKGDPGIVSSN